MSLAVQAEIRRAYWQATAGPGRFVPLNRIREAIPTKDKGLVDEALKAMLADDNVRLEPEPFGHRVGPDEQRAAVHIGGEDRHHLAIYGAGG